MPSAGEGHQQGAVPGALRGQRVPIASDPLVAGHEATFLICSFWLVDNYAMAGRLDEAQALLERLMSLRNELGLLAEEYHPTLRRQLGNYPQAFSHVGLINSAAVLEAKRLGREPTFPATLAEAMH